MTKIYIAGKFEAQRRLRSVRAEIESRGLGEVVGTWLDEEEAPGKVTEAQKFEYAVRDLSEIRQADLLILDTYDDNLRGGREVEYGYAIASGAAVWVVGPKRNVFHELASVFPSWGEALHALDRAQALEEASI